MAFRPRFKLRQGQSLKKLVKLIMLVLIGLYVSGTIWDNFGDALLCQYSPLFTGFSLIGWTVDTSYTPATEGGTCNATTYSWSGSTTAREGTITSTSGTGGVLAVLGIIALAGVITSVVSIRL